jgi:L-asparaginase II
VDSNASCAAVLVEVWRGPIIESLHRGHLIALNGEGDPIAQLGDSATITFIRSSGKPFQAIPLVASGAADRFGLSEKEIAIACGSHSGEPIHVEATESILRKIGLHADALKCGVHEPFSVDVARQLVKNQQPPNVLQNNCSGKHAGMLALAKHLGAPVETYDNLDNPVQQQILRAVSQFADIPPQEIAIGIDGCGVPVFGLSVRAMALMYGRLVNPPAHFDLSVKAACRRILRAMITYPEMVGGTKDRLDTELIRAANGRLISKIGAEGVYTVGVLPCDKWPSGVGFALKMEDGDDKRARPPAVIEALRQLRVLNDQEISSLTAYAPTPITNRRGERVGEARAAFSLNFSN